ncbi:MAG TPA: hypothetical protein VEG60_22670 [Candidatus Binatia bacterium]|nr:hypothetical protein [Candidatus Binatia bacterium]
MIKEPNKLVAARAELERAAEDLGDPARLGHLRNAISSLLQLMSGVYPRIEKDIAKKLLLTYRNKVVSQTKVVLANLESYEPGYLEHWNRVMEAFVDPRLADDPEFTECKKKLVARRRNQAINNLKAAHVDIPKKAELPAAARQNDFYSRKTKEVRTMLHAKSLSTIGPYLEILRLRAFELEKQGDFYIVRSELLTEAHEGILRNNLAEQGENTYLTVGNGWLCYGPLGTAYPNVWGLEKRDHHGFKQTDKLAQLLGIVGDHLDSKKATAFKILWSPDSVSVDYEPPTGVRERREFTIQKLQQLALYSERLSKR